MKKLYRIEIDVLLDDASKRCLVEKARRQYDNGAGAWTVEAGIERIMSKEEFIDDCDAAILELLETALRSALPGLEPQALRCRAVKGVNRGGQDG
jgi:hypothetical protein